MKTDNVPVWLPRVASSLAAVLVGWAAQKNFQLDVEWVTGGMLLIYSLGHRWLSSKTNPGDAAKRELVAPARATVATEKAVEKANANR